jgi:hypothetical protein
LLVDSNTPEIIRGSIQKIGKSELYLFIGHENLYNLLESLSHNNSQSGQDQPFQPDYPSAVDGVVTVPVGRSK